MRPMTIHGVNKKPKTEPTPARAPSISRLCNQTRGVKNHKRPQAIEIAKATDIGKERPSGINIPHENRNVNKILKVILSFDVGMKKSMRPSEITIPKK